VKKIIECEMAERKKRILTPTFPPAIMNLMRRAGRLAKVSTMNRGYQAPLATSGEYQPNSNL